MHLPSLSLLWELLVTTFPDIFSCICHPGVVETMPKFLLIFSHLFGGVQGVLMTQVTGLMQVLSLWKCCILSWRAHNAGENAHEKSCCGSSPSHKACLYLTAYLKLSVPQSDLFLSLKNEVKQDESYFCWRTWSWSLPEVLVVCCLAEVSAGQSAAWWPLISWLHWVVLQVSLWSWWVAPPWEHPAVGCVVTATHPQTL